MSYTKTSKMDPTKMMPNSRKFYHWPAAIGIRQHSSMEDLSSQILTSVGSILDEHSKVVRDEIFTVRELTRELKNTVDLLKEDNLELNKKCKFLLGENVHLSKDLLELKIAVNVGKENSDKKFDDFAIPGPSGEIRGKDPSSTEIDLDIENDISENYCPKTKFTTRSAKTDWFWTAAKEKKINSCSGSRTSSFSEDSQTVGKTFSGRQRRVGKDKRMPFAWANNCRLVGENSKDKYLDISRWEDLNNVEQEVGGS